MHVSVRIGLMFWGKSNIGLRPSCARSNLGDIHIDNNTICREPRSQAAYGFDSLMAVRVYGISLEGLEHLGRCDGSDFLVYQATLLNRRDISSAV